MFKANVAIRYIMQKCSPYISNILRVICALLYYGVRRSSTFDAQNVLYLAEHDHKSRCRCKSAQHRMRNKVEQKTWKRKTIMVIMFG